MQAGFRFWPLARHGRRNRERRQTEIRLGAAVQAGKSKGAQQGCFSVGEGGRREKSGWQAGKMGLSYGNCYDIASIYQR